MSFSMVLGQKFALINVLLNALVDLDLAPDSVFELPPQPPSGARESGRRCHKRLLKALGHFKSRCSSLDCLPILNCSAFEILLIFRILDSIFSSAFRVECSFHTLLQ